MSEDHQEETSSNVEDQFRQFLAEYKIDISSLAGTKEEDRLLTDAKDQRTLGILKAVSFEEIHQVKSLLK